jgi:hypothetical protein
VQSAHKPRCVSHWRAAMLLTTCTCILAVDFNAFPRRFVKAEVYGTGLVSHPLPPHPEGIRHCPLVGVSSAWSGSTQVKGRYCPASIVETLSTPMMVYSLYL